MDRRSFIKALTALAGAVAAPAFAVPVVDADTLPAVVRASSGYSIRWVRGYDLSRDAYVFRLDVVFGSHQYGVDAISRSSVLDADTKQAMERVLADSVLHDHGICIEVGNCLNCSPASIG